MKIEEKSINIYVYKKTLPKVVPTMKLRALAKINLGLDVTGKREDGYHEVRMVMQTIQMYDQLEIKESKRTRNKAYNQSAVPSV